MMNEVGDPLLHSDKTVIILDHSAPLLRSSQEHIEYDVFTKSRGIIPLAPIAKSLWTCNIEAALEYCRIVYDVCPSKKLIRIIASDKSPAILNGWSLQEQNLQQLLVAFAKLGPPDGDKPAEEYSIVHGLNQALEALCEPTEAQLQELDNLEDGGTMTNYGRIICVSPIKSDSQVKVLEECVNDALVQHNKLVESSDNLLPVTHCDLVLLHVVPVGQDSKVVHRIKRSVSPYLTSEVHISQSGHYIAAKLVELSVSHFHLASTTVTGIPMKEEQNASSSANYDVELLHAAEAHDEVIKCGHSDTLTIPSKEGLLIDTITLKWCTPKSSGVELHPCMGAYRISPVDVNSRPSSCLTNFLLSGRAVMLEQPRKSGTKVISHMLTSHGGEIYMHVLSTNRNILEDPPSISEGCGGRVTDYRINDFGELMKQSRLAPSPNNFSQNSDELPIEKAQAHLERVTRYWPMVINETIIFNMSKSQTRIINSEIGSLITYLTIQNHFISHLEPLLQLIVQEHLTDDQVLECKKVIYHIVGMESRNEALPVPAAGTRGKGPKREEQYRQMWQELEKLVSAHATTSPDHQKVLECLLECRKPTLGSKPRSSSPVPMDTDKTTKEEKDDTPNISSWREQDRPRLGNDKSTEGSKVNRGSSDGHMAKKLKAESGRSLTGANGAQSVLAMWSSKVRCLTNAGCLEFSGRASTTGNKAELYKKFNEENRPLGDGAVK